MSRRNLASSVIHIKPDTAETVFPGTGDPKLADKMRDRFEVRIRRLGRTYRGSPGHGHYGHLYSSDAADHEHPAHHTCMGTVVFPIVWRDPNSDPCQYDGDVVVPVTHPVPSKWPLPPIPIVDNQPVYGGATGCEDVLLRYPVYSIDARGALHVRWDSLLHELAAGRYSASVYADNVLCGFFELDKKHCCAVDLSRPTSVAFTPLSEVLSKPESATDMFDAIATWASKTTCIIEPGDTLISVEDVGALCTTTFCKAPELVLSDGVTMETVTFVGCADGKLEVTRSGTGRIQGGATIRFDWTPTNATNAIEGC